MLVAASGVAACKQEIHFTRIPVAGVADSEAKATDTRVFLSIPTNLAPALEVIETAVPQELARWRDNIDGAACDRRKGPWLECMTANTSVALSRDGPAEATLDGSRLLVTLPIKYEINAKGYGWAAYLTDQRSGRMTVGVPFDVTLGADYVLDVRMGSDLVWSDKSAAFLQKGRVYFQPTADQRLKALLRAAGAPLRAAMADLPVRGASARAWSALHMPIELSKTPSLWLRGLPQRVSGAGFAVEAGQFVYLIGVDAKVGLHRGERPMPLLVTPLPEPARVSPPAAKAPVKTRLRLPYDVPAPGFAQAIAAAFAKTDLLESRADARAAPVKVRTIDVQLFPARDRLALELTLDVVEPRRLLGIVGKAYLVGRPTLDRETGILDLRDIGFPAAPPREQKTAPSLVRIGEEPFAGRLAAAARLDVTGPLDALLPRLNTLIRRSLDDAMELTGQFDQVTVASIDPIQGGFRFNLDLEGILALRATSPRSSGAMQQTGARP